MKVDGHKRINDWLETWQQHISSIKNVISYAELLRDKGSLDDIQQQQFNIYRKSSEFYEDVVETDVLQRAVGRLGAVDAIFMAATCSTSPSSGDIVGRLISKCISMQQCVAVA
jgi:hypothetical protein